MPKYAIVSGFLAASVSASALPELNPVEVVRQFYSWRLENGTAAAPEKAELDGMREWLTDELACLSDAASKYNDFIMRSFNAKPPYTDGDLYSGAFGMPDHFDVGAAQINRSDATVGVRFVKEGGSWSDTVHLRKTANKWRISDVERIEGQVFNLEFANHPDARVSAK
jgi:Protein of unknown function (DUF3828)